MRLAVFEGDVCASIERDLAAHNLPGGAGVPSCDEYSSGQRGRPGRAVLLLFICEHGGLMRNGGGGAGGRDVGIGV